MDIRKASEIEKVNFLFFILGLVFLFANYTLPNLSYLVVEYLVYFLPFFFYIMYRSVNYKKILRLKQIKINIIGELFAFSILLFIMFIVSDHYSSYIVQELKFMIVLNDVSQIHGIYDGFFYVVIIGVVPAITEEIFFRGIVLSSLKKSTNNFFALIMSSLLFAIFYLYFSNIIVALLLGIVLGYLSLVTSSIVPPIIVHVLLNIYLIVYKYFEKFPVFFSKYSIEELLVYNIEFVVLMVIMIPVFILAYILIRRIIRKSFILENGDMITIGSSDYFVVQVKNDGVLLSEKKSEKREYVLKTLEEMKNIEKAVNKKLFTNRSMKFNYQYYFPLVYSMVIYLINIISLYYRYGIYFFE